MAKKLAQHMTRVVIIGTLKEYNHDPEKNQPGKGQVEIGGGNTARFSVWNDERENSKNPHTKATDFGKRYNAGDKVYITGQDNRSYSEAKDTYYEDVSLFDYRDAGEDEKSRYVYVYVADVKSINDEEMILSFIDFRKKETLFHINISKIDVFPEGFEEGTRVKVKGIIRVGWVEDFYGDGEFKAERFADSIEILNTKEEVEAATLGNGEGGSAESLWT